MLMQYHFVLGKKTMETQLFSLLTILFVLQVNSECGTPVDLNNAAGTCLNQISFVLPDTRDIVAPGVYDELEYIRNFVLPYNFGAGTKLLVEGSAGRTVYYDESADVTALCDVVDSLENAIGTKGAGLQNLYDQVTYAYTLQGQFAPAVNIVIFTAETNRTVLLNAGNYLLQQKLQKKLHVCTVVALEGSLLAIDGSLLPCKIFPVSFTDIDKFPGLPKCLQCSLCGVSAINSSGKGGYGFR